METGGGFSRRRMRTAEQKFDSPNLGDFLRVREASNANGGSDNLAGLTLGAVLGREPRSSTAELPHRSLLDIIRADPFPSKGNRKSWKHITGRLCLRIPGSSSEPGPRPVSPPSDPPLQVEESHQELIQDPVPTASPDSTTLIVLLQRSSSRAVDRGSSRPEAEEVEAGDQPARLSLMTLLAETDREMGLDGGAFLHEEEEEVAGGGGGKIDQCCVCMIRHKGAAFIPCGHTFCRRYSRELWVQRGSCPLCNHSISEVLDIF